MIKLVMRAGVSGTAMREKPRFGWMDGIKSALTKRRMSLEAARVRDRDRNEWRDRLTQVGWVSMSISVQHENA